MSVSAGLLCVALLAGPTSTPPEDAASAAHAEELDALDRLFIPSPGGLTADQAAAATLRNSPEHAGASARIAQAQADRARARLGWIPRIQGRASYERRSIISTELGGTLVAASNEGPLTVAPCPSAPGANCVADTGGRPVVATRPEIETLANNVRLGVEATVPISDYVLAVPAVTRAAKARVHAREAEQQAIELEVQVRAREAYFAWVRARGAHLVLEHSERRLERHEADARRAVGEGAAAHSKELLVRAELARTRAALSHARAEERAAWARLTISMGEDPDATTHDVPREVGEDLRTIEPSAPRESGTRAIDRAAAQHVRAARANRWGALASVLPRVGVTAGMLHGNPHPWYFPPASGWNSSWAVGVVSTWSIDGAIRGGVTMRRRKAELAAAEAERAILLRDRDIAHHGTRHREHAASEALAQTTIANEAARELLTLTQARHRAGSARLAELLDAENTLAQASVGELDARIQLRLVQLHARHLAGTLQVIR